MTATCDVVVIGGGMIGAAIAYELGLQGLSCQLIERRHVASGASGANMGLIELQDVQIGPMLPLTLQGFQRMAGLEAELDHDLEYQPHGTLLLLQDEADVVRSMARRRALNDAGIPMTFVPPERIRELEPAVRRDRLAGALYLDEAQMNPLLLVHGMVDRARQGGAIVRTGCQVRGLVESGGMVRGVQLADETISCGAVVLATAAWTNELLEPLGLSLPLWVMKGQAAITEPIPPLLHNFVGLAFSRRAELERRTVQRGWGALVADPGSAPVVTTPAATQTRHGGLILGQVSAIVPFPDEEIIEPGLSSLAAVITDVFPGLGRTAVVRSWASPVPFTVDHEPIIGPLPGHANLFVACGFKSAMVVAPTMGNLIASWLASGRMPAQLGPFTAHRFEASKG